MTDSELAYDTRTATRHRDFLLLTTKDPWPVAVRVS
jgi:hypothetical protein